MRNVQKKKNRTSVVRSSLFRLNSNNNKHTNKKKKTRVTELSLSFPWLRAPVSQHSTKPKVVERVRMKPQGEASTTAGIEQSECNNCIDSREKKNTTFPPPQEKKKVKETHATLSRVASTPYYKKKKRMSAPGCHCCCFPLNNHVISKRGYCEMRFTPKAATQKNIPSFFSGVTSEREAHAQRGVVFANNKSCTCQRKNTPMRAVVVKRTHVTYETKKKSRTRKAKLEYGTSVMKGRDKKKRKHWTATAVIAVSRCGKEQRNKVCATHT